MGGIITKDNSMNKIILYRADHHNSGKFMTFFTNLSGLICSLNASEHHSDENLNLYVYECDIDLQKIRYNMLPTDLPINKDYVNKQYEFCAKIYDENKTGIESEYGDFFVANYDKIKNICKLKDTYILNFIEFRKALENNKEYQKQLKNINNSQDNKELFDKLSSQGIIKKFTNVDGKSKKRSKKKSKRRSRRKKSN